MPLSPRRLLLQQRSQGGSVAPADGGSARGRSGESFAKRRMASNAILTSQETTLPQGTLSQALGGESQHARTPHVPLSQQQFVPLYEPPPVNHLAPPPTPLAGPRVFPPPPALALAARLEPTPQACLPPPQLGSGGAGGDAAPAFLLPAALPLARQTTATVYEAMTTATKSGAPAAPKQPRKEKAGQVADAAGTVLNSSLASGGKRHRAASSQAVAIPRAPSGGVPGMASTAVQSASGRNPYADSLVVQVRRRGGHRIPPTLTCPLRSTDGQRRAPPLLGPLVRLHARSPRVRRLAPPAPVPLLRAAGRARVRRCAGEHVCGACLALHVCAAPPQSPSSSPSTTSACAAGYPRKRCTASRRGSRRSRSLPGLLQLRRWRPHRRAHACLSWHCHPPLRSSRQSRWTARFCLCMRPPCPQEIFPRRQAARWLTR